MAATMNSCVRMNVKCLNRVLKFQKHCLLPSPCRNIAIYKNCHKANKFQHAFSSVICTRHFCEKTKGKLTDEILENRLEQNQKDTESDDKTDNKEEKSKEQKGFTIFGRFYTWTFFGFSVFGLMSCMTCFNVVYLWGQPELDGEGNPVEDEYSGYPKPIAYMMRTYREVFFQVKVTREPSREKLLPEPLTYPYIQPPYTLVLEMTDILVHPEWTYSTGWRFKKRPGIDHFLRSVGPPLFEVVVFTKEQGMTADPIITQIDPENFIMYRLYRDATRYEDGLHIKDMNYLNRDLSKVIVIDWNKNAYKFNPENGFRLNKWTGDTNDLVLGELAEFLRALAASKVDDVRPVLQYYSQFDDPLAQFRENQQKLWEAEKERQAMAAQRGQKSLTANIWNKLKN